MNKYVSPIMEMELIDVEDILMSGEDDTTSEKGENETGGRPINPTSVNDTLTYFD